jgi:hypothetical protein
MAIDFRVISLGDLDLHHPKRFNRCVVRRRPGTAPERRMYAARIHGSDTSMTAVVYQGDGAKEVCMDLDNAEFSNLVFAEMAEGHCAIFTASVGQLLYFACYHRLTAS